MDDRSQIQTELLSSNIPKYRKNRLLAIYYHLDGLSPFTISQKVGISLRSVQRYIKEYGEQGPDGMFSRRPPGNANTLTPNQQEVLFSDLDHSPQEFGFIVSNWSAPTLAMHIEEKYGVAISSETCRLFLKEKLCGRTPEKVYKRLSLQGMRKDFDLNLNRLTQKDNAEVWLIGQFYLGYRAAYKTKVKNEKRRAVILCAIRYGAGKQVCRFFNPYRNKSQQWDEIVNEILSRTHKQTVYLFFPQSPTNKFVVNRLRNSSDHTVIAMYYPTGLSPELYLGNLKERIIQKIKLPKKNTKNKVLGKIKQDHLKVYLEELSQK